MFPHYRQRLHSSLDTAMLPRLLDMPPKTMIKFPNYPLILPRRMWGIQEAERVAQGPWWRHQVEMEWGKGG